MTQIVTIVRSYITNMWFAVCEELPCQSEQANSKDLFAVAVTAGKLIADLKKFPQQNWSILLGYLIRSLTTMSSASSTLHQYKFWGERKFPPIQYTV